MLGRIKSMITAARVHDKRYVNLEIEGFDAEVDRLLFKKGMETLRKIKKVSGSYACTAVLDVYTNSSNRVTQRVKSLGVTQILQDKINEKIEKEILDSMYKGNIDW